MIFAVGDIHGRYDLLLNLHEKIMKKASEAPEERHTIVFLGDMIDRGYDSKSVLEFLMTKPFDGFHHVFLKGNHEVMLQDFLNGDWQDKMLFLDNGGRQTVQSFGFDATSASGILEFLNFWMSDENFEIRNFIDNAKTLYETDEYFFVHAGVHPNAENPFDPVNTTTHIWIRDLFLKSDKDFGKVIVHGHTPIDYDPLNTGKEYYPVFRPNRINLDTGAFFTGILSAIELNTREVIQSDKIEKAIKWL